MIDLHKHLRKYEILQTPFRPRFGYKYCGLQKAKLEDQVLYDKNTGNIIKTYDKEKNNLDSICKKHDIMYSIAENKGIDSKDIKNRKKLADIQMIKEIDDIPYNQRPYGTAIVRGIINKKQQFGLSVNPNQILSQELHKPRKVNFERRKVISNNIDHIWGIDLITMIKYSKQNKNYKYILTVIDFFSKYSWCYPLKSKKSIEIINSFNDIFKKSKRKPSMIQSDQGTEFTNNQTQTFFKNNNIKWYHTFNISIKCSICERFNRTILNKIYKNFTLNNNTIWINDLDKLVNEYNNSYHRSIKTKPIDASKKSNENNVRNNLYNFKYINKKSKFLIGDRVRISLLKNTFEKSYTSNWSQEIFIIDDIKTSNVHYYFLKDLQGEKIDGMFYEQELLKSKQNDLYIIEKIIKKVGNKYLVKWKNYSDKFNSYVNQNDIVKYL